MYFSLLSVTALDKYTQGSRANDNICLMFPGAVLLLLQSDPLEFILKCFNFRSLISYLLVNLIEKLIE